MSAHEEFEKTAVMIDSGASETVASVEKFEFGSSWQASRGHRPRWSEILSSRRRSRHGELGQVPGVQRTRSRQDNAKRQQVGGIWTLGGFRDPGQGVTYKTTPTATGRTCGSNTGLTTLICR